MKERSNRISVVITCFNYGKYLEGCLKSVLDQTIKDIEIIVINDGSIDNTDSIIKPFLELPNIKYISQNNSGQAHAKNVGIRNASCDFIAFLDADDLWESSKLEKQLSCFNDPDVGVVYCRAKYLDENSKEIVYDMASKYLHPRRGKVTEWLILDNFVQFSSSVVRRECFERFGGFDETLKMGIDWDLWLRISTAYKFDFINEKLFYYRMGHSGQMSKNMEERQACADRIMADFLSNYPDALPPRVVRRAKAMTACSRGDFFRSKDLARSNRYYCNAILTNPSEIYAYKGMVKNLLFACRKLKP